MNKALFLIKNEEQNSKRINGWKLKLMHNIFDDLVMCNI